MGYRTERDPEEKKTYHEGTKPGKGEEFRQGFERFEMLKSK